ncbi:MAG: hypothetical protein HY231_17550 [Acidobacteria bacterium]|nr:hypothetical protein [Acidobacteriota bacterium]
MGKNHLRLISAWYKLRSGNPNQELTLRFAPGMIAPQQTEVQSFQGLKKPMKSGCFAAEKTTNGKPRRLGNSLESPQRQLEDSFLVGSVA